MEQKQKKDYSKSIITIPNLLSFLRILMIPLFVWLYVGLNEPYWTLLVVFLSGLSDVVDGFIARKFNMVSDFGKALDPVADKLTQIALMVCLVWKFPHIAIPLVLLVIKELISGILGLVTLKKTGLVEGAVWHGKLTTVLLYSTIVLHLVWPTIMENAPVLSYITVTVCCVMMLISFVLYTLRYMKMLKSKKED